MENGGVVTITGHSDVKIVLRLVIGPNIGNTATAVAILLLQTTIETTKESIPMNCAEIELVLVAKVNTPKRAPRGTRANTTTIVGPRKTFKSFTVWRERTDIAVERSRKLMADFHLIDVILA